jgi:hypothetical protein
VLHRKTGKYFCGPYYYIWEIIENQFSCVDRREIAKVSKACMGSGYPTETYIQGAHAAGRMKCQVG